MSKPRLKRKKSQPVTIKISSPFIIRAACKHCGSPPDKYYYIGSKAFYKDISDFKEDDLFNNEYFKINVSINKKMSIRRIINSSLPKYSITNKSLNIKYHKVRDSGAPFGDFRDEYTPVEHLTCKCGLTEWGYSDVATENRPEITNRQAKIKFPKKFFY